MKTCSRAVAAILIIVVAGCESISPESIGQIGSIMRQGELSPDTIAAGLKEALRVGSKRAAGQLSRSGGYSDNPVLRLTVPEELDAVAETLRTIGMGSYVDQFEAKMNDAAEAAAAKAVPVFADAVAEMTIEDAKQILEGPNDAATQYFREKTADDLREMYAPVVRRTMDDVGAANVYNDIMKRYNAIPLARKPDFSLEHYVTEKALAGLFTKLADMEQEIRTDPAARTTQLLKRVFGSR